MHSHHPFSFSPKATPRCLKRLLLFTSLFSLLIIAADSLFPSLLGWPAPSTFIALSAAGINHFYFWQFLSYFLIYPASQGFDFSFLLSLAFNLYILWFVGTSFIEKKGAIHFFTLYFLSGALAGAAVFALQTLSHSSFLFAGNIPILYALLVGWVFLFPEANLLLFFALPFKAKWVIYGGLGFNLIIDLSSGNWIGSAAALIGALIGFCYARYLPLKTGKKKFVLKAKRYDFKRGQPLPSEEEFLESMLTKISLHGKKSLSWLERWKLRRISKRKK